MTAMESAPLTVAEEAELLRRQRGRVMALTGFILLVAVILYAVAFIRL